MYDSSECMLRTITFGGCAIFWTRAVTSMPFIFGMPMSTINTSTRDCSQRWNACRPSAASAITWTPGSDSSRLRRPRRTMPWSSASKTCNRLLRWRDHRHVGRQPERHHRAAVRGMADAEPSLELLDALLHASQSEAAVTPRGVEPAPIVGDRDLQASVLPRQADNHPRRLRMLDAIGQCLLDDAADAGALRFRGGPAAALDPQLDRQP